MNQRYAYLIGANGPPSMRLKYAEKDAIQLGAVLQGGYCQFAATKVAIAHTRQDALAGFKQFAEQCEPSDLLLVHFSGHALFDETLYLLCNTTDLQDIEATSLEIAALKTTLRRCKARRKLLILDCCHAAGAHPGLFKGNVDIQGMLHTSLEGSAAVILSACAKQARTREFDELGGGSGFLSWAIRTGCSEAFEQASSTPELQTLSLHDLWRRWIPAAHREVNGRYGKDHPLPLPVMVHEEECGEQSEIWLTPPPSPGQPHTSSFDEESLVQQTYLENVYKRYGSVTLPIGPVEGFSLQAIFQPLTLRSDPLTAGDLERIQRRALLDEEKNDENVRFLSPKGDAPRKHLGGQEKAARHITAENGEDAISKSPQGRLVLLGSPGTGKTTTLRHLVSHQAREALRDRTALMPVFVSLPDLVRSGQTFQRYLTLVAEDMGVDRDYAQVLWQEIKRGHALVALDSLDEVDPKQRGNVITLINTWASEAGNIWLVGSRFTEYKGGQFKQGQFAEWELLSMNVLLRRNLAARLLPELVRLLPTSSNTLLSAERFVNVLENHAQAATWGQNPLLFSLAAVVFIKTGELPASRAVLYQEVVEAVLTRHEPDILSSQHLLRPLSGLALWLHQSGKRTFSSADLFTFLEEIQHRPWKDAEDIAQRVIASGLLDIVARDTYGFRHLTFQEYLAAVELAKKLTHVDEEQKKQTWEFIWQRHTYSRWTEILRLMMGVLIQQPERAGYESASHFLRQLLEQRQAPAGDPGDLNLLLALSLLAEIARFAQWQKSEAKQLERALLSTWLNALGEAIHQQQQTRGEKLLRIAEDLAHLPDDTLETLMHDFQDLSGDWGRGGREVLIEIIGQWSKRISIDQLILLPQESHGDVREAALAALSEQGERVSIDQLITFLQDEDWHVRVAAVEALGKQGEYVTIDLLITLLQDHDWRVRTAAIRILREQGERVPIDQLLALLQDDNREVRVAAVEALGKQGERIPIGQLLVLLQEEDWRMRATAVEALGKQGERTPIDQLIALLQDDNREVRAAAVEALGKQGERTPIDQLIILLQNDNWVVRKAAVEALGKRGERVPIDQFLVLLRDDDWSVRVAAVEALGKQGERTPIDQLIALLQDDNENVRVATVKALSKQGERVPIDQFIALFQDHDRRVRIAAIRVLREQGKRVPIDQLLALLQDDGWSVRVAAAEALGKQGNHISITHLIDLLQETAASVRLTAVTVLGEQGDYEEYLISLLYDTAPSIRAAVVEILGKQGERVTIDQLITFLQDEDWRVREAAVETLGKQGERITTHQLLALFQDHDWHVQAAAIRVLREQGKRVPIDQLLALLQDDNRDVRVAAVKALSKQGERVTIDQLIALLQDEDWRVREAAVETLGKQGEQVPIDQLTTLLQNNNWRVRTAAIRVLHGQGERVPIDLLLALLQNGDADARAVAVEALGKQEGRAPIGQLIALLQDDDAAVRVATVEALGKQGERVPIDLLLALLQNDDSSVRVAVAETLGKQGERVPIDQLLALLQDDDADVRVAAVEALGKQEERAPIDQLLVLLQDDDWSVRGAAVEALSKQKERVPIDQLIALLQDDDADVREAVVVVLSNQAGRIALHQLLFLYYNENVDIRSSVLQAITAFSDALEQPFVLELLGDQEAIAEESVLPLVKKVAPLLLDQLAQQAIGTLLQGSPQGEVFTAHQQQFIAETLGNLGIVSPLIFEKLTELLDHPHWLVRLKAIRAFGKIRRSIPNAAIRRLLELRVDPDPKMYAIRNAADEALGEILSLETGIEDE